MGCLWHPSRACVYILLCLDPSDGCPWPPRHRRPPFSQRGFHDAPVGGLPFPIDPQFFAVLLQEDGPRPSQTAAFHPRTEALMGCGHRRIAARQLTPLAARPGQPNQAVEDASGVPRGTPRLFARLLDNQQRCSTCPQSVWNFPEGRLRIDLRLVRLGRRHLLSLHIFRIGS